MKVVPPVICSDVERQVTAGAVPLVGYLLTDRAFIEVIQLIVCKLCFISRNISCTFKE